jgi:hypothetical protein
MVLSSAFSLGFMVKLMLKQANVLVRANKSLYTVISP